MQRRLAELLGMGTYQNKGNAGKMSKKEAWRNMSARDIRKRIAERVEELRKDPELRKKIDAELMKCGKNRRKIRLYTGKVALALSKKEVKE